MAMNQETFVRYARNLSMYTWLGGMATATFGALYEGVVWVDAAASQSEGAMDALVGTSSYAAMALGSLYAMQTARYGAYAWAANVHQHVYGDRQQ